MNFFARMRRRLQHSDLFVVFNFREERAFGRTCMLLSAILSTIVTYLTAGTLYTAFLTFNNFSIADVGVISYLPLLGACFNLFSPIILERFKRRRWILAGGRFVYYTINIVGLTLLALFVHDPTAKLVGFGAIVFLASLINNLFGSGYTVWHLNFIPEDVRAKYISYQQTITTLFSGMVLLVSSAAADALRGTPNEGALLTALRFIGYVVAVIEIVVLILPREYAYPQKERVRLSSIFRLPMQNRKFLATMGIMAFWTFLSHLPAASWSYYVLNTAQTSITMISMLDFVYGFFLLILSPFWRRMLRKHSWFSTFVIASFMHAPTAFACAFVTANTQMWLYPLMRIGQHIAGVGLNLAYANFPYINTPKENQTCYISFYMLLVNLVAFIAQLCGNTIIRLVGDNAVPMLGVPMSVPQLLMFTQGVLILVCAVLIMRFHTVLTPQPATEAEA